ncbi:hypothetical protein [Streptomyces sp. NPDC003635]
MSTDHRRSARTTIQQAEVILVGQYPGLVALAYLTLPASLGRHRRVLVAHGIVQRALPGSRTVPAARRVPAQRGSGESRECAWLRERVLREALRYEIRPRGWPRRLPAPRRLRPALPVVWGLRLFPRAGGEEEVQLARLLAGVPAASRAAFVLRHLERVPDEEVLRLLRAAGEGRPERALRTAVRLEQDAGPAAETLLRSREFDACSVQIRPTDLLRRRRRLQLACAGLAAAALAGAALAVTTTDPEEPLRAAPVVKVPSLGQLVRVPEGQWADTSRVDFTAWPARGELADDKDLLRRALNVWAEPSADTAVTTTASTTAEPPRRAPQLLYAGKVNDTTVVLFHEADQVVRYTERGARTTLAFARTDEADVTTAAALVVARSDDSVRYVTAPWIAEAQTRDLLRPDTPGSPLSVNEHGITDDVPAPPGAGGCSSWPVLQLRSSSRIVEKHAFLVTDLGGLTATHLTYTPLPSRDQRARQPREATSSAALASWAHGACRLDALRGRDVRAVNHWDFAEQDLPEGAGTALWSCSRVSSWRGPGDVLVQFRESSDAPDAPAKVVAQARSTAACSRFGQHVVAATSWKAPSGRTYLLAAGSREVTALRASGDVEETAQGRTLAVRTPDDTARASVRATLSDGGTLREVDEAAADE